MDALAKQMKAMIEKATARCEAAPVSQLEAWAAQDTINAVFAQHELKYREMESIVDDYRSGRARSGVAQ